VVLQPTDGPVFVSLITAKVFFHDWLWLLVSRMDEARQFHLPINISNLMQKKKKTKQKEKVKSQLP
jgi:hypothetical protein